MNKVISRLVMTYIGGPTLLVEWGGLRFLTDPTFDPAGTDYPTNLYTLKKREGPAIRADELGDLNAVLLSHDDHYDNLDHAGRQMLAQAAAVLTTSVGAERLGARSVPLTNWQSIDIPCPDGRLLRVTGTPARHGPAGGDRGPVTGFVLAFTDTPGDCLYISGDTVWYDGIAEVAQRFKVTTAVLFMGAAVVPQVSTAHLTMTAEEGIRAARAFGEAVIVPLHYSGWEHFTQSRDDIERMFAAVGLHARLRWLKPGIPTIIYDQHS